MLVKQKSLSHSCEKGFIVICYLYFSFRYMRQAFSHRNPGMIIIDRIIIKPSSRINLSSRFCYFVAAKLYTPDKLTKQMVLFLK